MTEGTSQGLFVVVAIVIFGIFVGLSYTIFGDTLQPATESLFTTAVGDTYTKLTGDLYMKDATPVKFEDETMENVVREIADLGSQEELPEITVEDLDSVTEIVSENKGITDISGIEYIRNLESIDLSGNEIINIEPLKTMMKLKTIDLSNNHIENVEPLKNLEKVAVLNLDTNHVLTKEQVTTFNNLPIKEKSLRNQTVNLNMPVTITDNVVKNSIIKELGLATDTETLTVGDLKNLTKLDLSEKGITNLIGLGYATNLVELNVSKNTITDLTPIKNLTNLKTLNISYNKLTSETLTNLESMTGLTSLDARGNSLPQLAVDFLNYLPITNKLTAQTQELPASSDYKDGLGELGMFSILGYRTKGVVELEVLRDGSNIFDNNTNTSAKVTATLTEKVEYTLTIKEPVDIYRFYINEANSYSYGTLSFIDAQGKTLKTLYPDKFETGYHDISLSNVKKVRFTGVGNVGSWYVKEFELFGFTTIK